MGEKKKTGVNVNSQQVTKMPLDFQKRKKKKKLAGFEKSLQTHVSARHRLNLDPNCATIRGEKKLCTRNSNSSQSWPR